MTSAPTSYDHDTVSMSPQRGPSTSSRRRSSPAERRRRWTLTGFASPAVILLMVVNAYPVVFAAIQSLHGGGLISLGPFVGLDNFGNALTDPAFWQAVRFTAIFSIAGVFGSWLVGFALALMLQGSYPLRGFYRVLLLLPWIVPIVVSSMSWNWLIGTQSSLLPVIAKNLGFGDVLFLADPTLAAVMVCIFKIWISYPFMMMMAGSALQGVDTSVYEAAMIDGVSRWQRLRYITLPLTAKSTYISWVLMTMFSVNDFPTIYLLTGGGPVGSTTSLVVLAYRSVFQDFQPGYGIAVAFLMTAVLVTVSLVLFRRIRSAHAE